MTAPARRPGDIIRFIVILILVSTVSVGYPRIQLRHCMLVVGTGTREVLHRRTLTDQAWGLTPLHPPPIQTRTLEPAREYPDAIIVATNGLSFKKPGDWFTKIPHCPRIGVQLRNRRPWRGLSIEIRGSFPIHGSLVQRGGKPPSVGSIRSSFSRVLPTRTPSRGVSDSIANGRSKPSIFLPHGRGIDARPR